MTRVDCHQHVWTDAFVEELRRRSRPPYLVGDRLHLAGEPAYDVDWSQHDLAGRRDGVDLALLSLSSPLGIETLDPAEAAPLLAAWHALAAELGPGHGLWAAVSLVEPDLDGLRQTARRAGGARPAGAGDRAAHAGAVERLAPVLRGRRGGRPARARAPRPRSAGRLGRAGAVPAWWPALTSYPAQLATAWFAWHVAGRALLPGLRDRLRGAGRARAAAPRAACAARRHVRRGRPPRLLRDLVVRAARGRRDGPRRRHRPDRARLRPALRPARRSPGSATRSRTPCPSPTRTTC